MGKTIFGRFVFIADLDEHREEDDSQSGLKQCILRLNPCSYGDEHLPGGNVLVQRDNKPKGNCPTKAAIGEHELVGEGELLCAETVQHGALHDNTYESKRIRRESIGTDQ